MTSNVDIEVTLHADPEGAFAICVSDDGEKRNSVWLPRSQIDIHNVNAVEGDVITITLPEWLAEDKGLI